MEGLNVPQDMSYCPKCRKPVRGKRGIQFWLWVLNLGLSILSYGLWLILFIPYFFLKPKVCPLCLNSKLEGYPMGRNF